jgi:hypothetical protein
MFGVGVRVPTQVLGPWYQLRACLTHLVGSMWGLPPRHTGLVSHYGQARGVGDEPTMKSIVCVHSARNCAAARPCANVIPDVHDDKPQLLA